MEVECPDIFPAIRVHPPGTVVWSVAFCGCVIVYYGLLYGTLECAWSYYLGGKGGKPDAIHYSPAAMCKRYVEWCEQMGDKAPCQF